MGLDRFWSSKDETKKEPAKVEGISGAVGMEGTVATPAVAAASGPANTTGKGSLRK